MHHSHIRVLLRRSVLRASPHAGNQPRQQVCVPGASPAPSHTAAGASQCQGQEREPSKDVPYCLRPLGMPHATDQATFGLL